MKLILFFISTFCLQSFGEGQVFCTTSDGATYEEALNLAQEKMNQKLDTLRVREATVSAPSHNLAYPPSHVASICVTINPR